MSARLILFKGLPGSGKSTLSRALGESLNLPLIDKDDINDVLHEQVAASGGLAYEVMLNIVRCQLLQGLSVICDSPLLYGQTYERAQAIATEANASIAIVECICSDKHIWQIALIAANLFHSLHIAKRTGTLFNLILTHLMSTLSILYIIHILSLIPFGHGRNVSRTLFPGLDDT